MHTISKPTMYNMVSGVFAIFVVVAAIPFVPGAEIGFALLMLFGGKASLLVYMGMVSALMLSFLVARLVPTPILSNCLNWIGLKKASGFVSKIDALAPEERLDQYAALLPEPVGKLIVKNRYLVLATAFNLPGNTLIGGGGGLAFMAGSSGLFGFWAYLAVVLCAVAPIPVLFLLM
ncbi:hypothetical protein [Shimia sp.]|uniref:hypothetical protein n=1 Tax=Shimia sp. TaxID=1954381 RepID=UPI00329A1C25